ncbi:MAG: hypothetical protein JHC87_00550 [Thermoleophilaceae bacterium]|nr:hypothetical protein [Thermoleophilaceae bacterium]
MSDLRKSAEKIFYDLQARKLLVPCAILALLIVASVYALPKSPAPFDGTGANAGPVHTVERPKMADVAALSLVGDSDINRKRVHTSSYGANPFGFVDTSGVTCSTFAVQGAEDPNVQGVATVCSAPGSSPGATAPVGQPTPVPTDPNNTDGDTGDSTVYTVDTELDGTKFKGLEAGAGMPEAEPILLYFAGVTSSHKKAQFLIGDGISVQGADFDADLGVFTVAPGDSVVLTDDVTGAVHQFQLDKIKKS